MTPLDWQLLTLAFQLVCLTAQMVALWVIRRAGRSSQNKTLGGSGMNSPAAKAAILRSRARTERQDAMGMMSEATKMIADARAALEAASRLEAEADDIMLRGDPA